MANPERVRGRYEIFTPEQIDKMTEDSAKVAVDALQQLYIPRVSYWAAVEGALISLFMGGILYQLLGVVGIYLGIATAGLVKKFTDSLFAHTKHTIVGLWNQYVKKEKKPDDSDKPDPGEPTLGG